jgi:hypothetical protein
MKYNIFTIIIALLFSLTIYGQNNEKRDVYDLSIPKTIEQCLKVLDKTMFENEIYLIKTLQEDSIYYHNEFMDGADFFHAWKLYDGSRLTKYFNKKGLYGSHPIYNTILVSYHRYLNKESINLDEQIRKYQQIQEQEKKEYLLKLQNDTINGVYIPQNLEDCFVQLDKILSEDDKNTIKKLANKEETIQYHHGLGMWLRNNWGLWGGSRLQTYFLNGKINHPDDMSALILEYYYDWLNDKNDDWKKWNEKSNAK